MANGQVVLVTTEGLSGGSPMRTVYYVAEEDPTKAKAIIAKIMAPNEKVEAYGLLPEAAVKALGLKPGEFRSVLSPGGYVDVPDARRLGDQISRGGAADEAGAMISDG